MSSNSNFVGMEVRSRGDGGMNGSWGSEQCVTRYHVFWKLFVCLGVHGMCFGVLDEQGRKHNTFFNTSNQDKQAKNLRNEISL